MQEVRRQQKRLPLKAKQLLHPKAGKRAGGEQKNTRSVRNTKLATYVVNVTSVEVAPLSAFPEDADADAEQTKKKEPVKNIIHENINNLVN